MLRKIKMPIFILLATVLLTLLPLDVLAQGTDAVNQGSTVKTVTATFTTAARKTYSIEVPYSDAYFDLDCNEYHHELAKLSIALTVASYRVGTETYAGDFLTDAGFTNIDLTPYETLPTTDSIANCIGMKQIGDTTVIAVGVCGGGYGKEWASNVMVGTGERSQGFNEAAQQVISRINTYIDQNNISGKMILWVSGQSRAGATSNIVAADMTDSGKFEKVFGYTFGTPRTTRNKGNYTNIYNIMSKDDIVPKVPLPEWGYERYGVDLYLPAQEYDSDYCAKGYLAYYAIPDAEFRNNTELYDDFRVISGYFYELVPDVESYNALLQDDLRGIIASDDTDDTIAIIRQLVENIEPENEAQEEEQTAFLEFLDRTIAKYVLYGNRQQTEKQQWLVDSDFGSNIMVDHMVTAYASWMLSSDDGEGLYSDNMEFLHLTLNTGADVSIYSGNALIQTIHPDGSVDYTGTGYTEDDIYLAYSRNGLQVVIDLPLDREYTVRYTPTEDETGEMIAVKYNATAVVAKDVFTTELKAEKGQPCTLKSVGNGTLSLTVDGRNIAGLKLPSATVPMSLVTKLEDINVFNLSANELVCLIVAALGALLIELALGLVFAIYRKITHRERSRRSIDIVFAINMVLLTILEIGVWYYAPALPLTNVLPALVCSIVIFAYAAGGKNRLLLIPFGAVLALLPVCIWFWPDPLSSWIGVAAVIVRQVVLTAAAAVIRKKGKAAVKSA